MTEYTWFIAASAAAWSGICAYILFIARAQQALQKRLQQWEIIQEHATQSEK